MDFRKTWQHLFRASQLALFLALISSPIVGAQSPPGPPPINAKAAELVDANSGQVLYTKNAQQELPMASVTKLMTLYIAVRAIERHQIRLHDMVPADEEAYRIGGSQIWLEPGERLSVDQMLKAVAVGSANDAAYALGTYISGSEAGFVQQMNETAKALGMTHTHFSNPHGLPQSNHYSSAHDLAILGEKAVKLPLLLKYTSLWEDRSIRNGKGGTLWLVNHNRLLRTYPGADGLKTGFTREAGYCMVATAKKGDTRMVVAILGAPTGKIRAQDAASLLTWGFQNFRTVSIAPAHKIMGYVDVRRGVEPRVAAWVVDPVLLTLPASSGHISQALTLPREVQAPVRVGQALGHLEIKSGRHVIRSVPIVAAGHVARTTIGALTWKYLWKLFT
ncbi:MAG: D-alanyl-D-alanine carboxypeptidase [Sulfobacillus thermotolerans]|nr:D-alanyl-D-alanine carboxypeptidase [Sulfobacillus thermotolerans]